MFPILEEQYISQCPGTFGELVQGKLNGKPFLITLPINRFSVTYMTMSQQKYKKNWQTKQFGIPKLKSEFKKTRLILEALSKIVQRPLYAEMHIESPAKADLMWR